MSDATSPLSIIATVKQHILDRFLPDEDPANLTETTPLLSGGILDSISTIELVAFLEKQFSVKFEAYEVGEERLDTLQKIAETVHAKLAAK